MAQTNTGMHTARNNKKDEFYTRLEDIQDELKYHKEAFKGQTVFCNCDDPYESNFVKYFLLKFNELGLKKFIATCYDGSPEAGNELTVFDLFGQDYAISVGQESVKTLASEAYKIEVTEVNDLNGDGVIDLDDIKLLLKTPGVVTPLKGNGDFRSTECIKLLDEADICATNPPFSLFRDYIALMVEHNKKFIILGNTNAITYKEVFPLIRDNKLWTGHAFNKTMIFKTPYANTQTASRNTVIKNGLDPEEGYTAVPSISWFTNLPVHKHEEDLLMYETYSPDKFYHYENYPAINVDEVKKIPVDYFGYMGVPITFLDKYNPEQFEIINLSRYLSDSTGLNADFVSNYNNNNKNAIPEGYKDLGYYDENGIATIPYMRIIIKRKYTEDGAINA